MADNEGLECNELRECLLAKGLHEEVVSNIVANRIDGELFTGLSEVDIKDLAPASGDRIRLRRILDDAKKVI